MEKVHYEIVTEVSEKQMEYYRQRKPWKTLLRIESFLQSILGGVLMAFNMILFIVAKKEELSLWNGVLFLLGGLLLVDGAIGMRWIDKLYQKRIEKKQLDGKAIVSFFDETIVVRYETYGRTETFSYQEIKKADNDFEGYYLKLSDRLLYLKRKQFQVGDGWEFPNYFNEKAPVHLKSEK